MRPHCSLKKSPHTHAQKNEFRAEQQKCQAPATHARSGQQEPEQQRSRQGRRFSGGMRHETRGPRSPTPPNRATPRNARGEWTRTGLSGGASGTGQDSRVEGSVGTVESGGLRADEQEEEEGERQQGERGGADAAHLGARRYSIARAADLEARGGAGLRDRRRDWQRGEARRAPLSVSIYRIVVVAREGRGEGRRVCVGGTRIKLPRLPLSLSLGYFGGLAGWLAAASHRLGTGRAIQASERERAGSRAGRVTHARWMERLLTAVPARESKGRGAPLQASTTRLVAFRGPCPCPCVL
jgi:hypothetical protein